MINRLMTAAVITWALIAPGCGGGTTSRPAETTAPAGTPTPSPVTAGWKVTEGIATPESVYLDEGSAFIFSSQIDGAPDVRDGNGRIAQLTSDGRVVSANWLTGLNAPKGLRSYKGTLWIADIDELIGVDIPSAKITSRLKIPGAMFLNDVAVDDDGTVYVSDMMGNRIHAVRDGIVSVFAEGEQLEWPNGLVVDGNRLIVGGWGKPKPDFSTDVPGHLFALDLQTKQKTLITPQPLANIDGLESDGRGGYLISDFIAGTVLHVTADGEARELRRFMPGAADIGFVPARNILLVPHMNENTIASYDLSDVIK
jgi:hypothetical protein